MDSKPSLFLIITWTLFLLAIGVFTARSLSASLDQKTFAVEPCTTPNPSLSPTPSPTSTPIPTTSPSPSPSTLVTNVYLTEFMACPASGNEWLELFNANTTEVIVTNWQVLDETGNKKYLNGTIPGNTFVQFDWTGSLLNNAGDSFSVITATGQTIGTASYTDCTTGISYVYEAGTWVGALESPEEDTLISSVSLPISTAAATLAAAEDTTDSLASAIVATPHLNVNNISESMTPPPYQLPFLTLSHPLTSPPTTRQSQSPPNPLPAISVIMGGLFQLLPSSAALYGNTKKYFA